MRSRVVNCPTLFSTGGATCGGRHLLVCLPVHGEGRGGWLLSSSPPHPLLLPSAWPFQRIGILPVLDFKPSPRMGSPIVVNGMPFMGASLGVTLWQLENAHVMHTDEGTVLWTRTHAFPISFNNPGSAMPTVMPFRKGNKSIRRVEFDKLLVLGGSMWCQLIQHWVMEGLPLLEAAYDLINVRWQRCLAPAPAPAHPAPSPRPRPHRHTHTRAGPPRHAWDLCWSARCNWRRRQQGCGCGWGLPHPCVAPPVAPHDSDALS